MGFPLYLEDLSKMIEKQLIKEYPERPEANTPKKIFELCEDIRDSEVEAVALFLLDARLNVIRREIISIGNINSSIICPREIFKRAVMCNASSVIIEHNHPSGDATPSTEDIEMTESLMKAGEILNVQVIDHIITTKNTFHSIEHGGEK